MGTRIAIQRGVDRLGLRRGNYVVQQLTNPDQYGRWFERPVRKVPAREQLIHLIQKAKKDFRDSLASKYGRSTSTWQGHWDNALAKHHVTPAEVLKHPGKFEGTGIPKDMVPAEVRK